MTLSRGLPGWAHRLRAPWRRYARGLPGQAYDIAWRRAEGPEAMPGPPAPATAPGPGGFLDLELLEARPQGPPLRARPARPSRICADGRAHRRRATGAALARAAGLSAWWLLPRERSECGVEQASLTGPTAAS
jgi:hypothetical protein